MDLPISRIAQGNLKQTAGGLDIIDCVFNQKLVSLDCTNVSAGDCVVLAREGGDENRTYVFTVSSDYEFETLNRRALFKAIENKLGGVGITVFELGILLEILPGIYDVRRCVIRTKCDDTGKCHYELLTTIKGSMPLPKLLNIMRSNWT